jgi:hypothetical protein
MSSRSNDDFDFDDDFAFDAPAPSTPPARDSFEFDDDDFDSFDDDDLYFDSDDDDAEPDNPTVAPPRRVLNLRLVILIAALFGMIGITLLLIAPLPELGRTLAFGAGGVTLLVTIGVGIGAR